jgi:predicted DNA-binding antitoxin AbrB/MazE fold protein
MAAKDDKYYIVKKPEEQLHQVLVADYENGVIKALSKIDVDRSIVYKIFYEDENKKVKVLADGKGDDDLYNQEIKKIADKMLIPHGETWQKVEPIIIER